MRRWFVLSLLLLTAAKRDKKPAEPPPPPPAAEPAVEEPAPEEPPPPPPEPEVVKNTSFQASLTWVGGTPRAGHVTGLERTVDFNGYDGWTAEERKLKLQVEVAGVEKEIAWTDVASISITPGKVPDDVDCTSNSAIEPMMYECTLRTTSSAVLKDGSKALVTDRHMWRFTWEDGTTTELQVYKFTVRVPDATSEGEDAGSAPAPFVELQAQISAALKSGLLKTVEIK